MTTLAPWWEEPLPDRICSRIIADTLAPDGQRITTFEARYNRYFHSEVLTHGLLSRNSSSSRAIPYWKLRQQIMASPAAPSVWAANQAGMQGTDEIVNADGAAAVWNDARLDAVAVADWMSWFDGEARRQLDPKDPADVARAALLGFPEQPLHKSIPNRLVEPWMFITVTVTAVDWEGFLNQRSSHRTDGVLPEFGQLAAGIEDQLAAGRPVQASDNPRHPEGWHLPYIREAERDEFSTDELRKISTGRVARTSYLTHTGERDPQADIVLYESLKAPEFGGPQHASPFQHIATPAAWNQLDVHINPADYDVVGEAKRITVPIVGNTRGWLQFRHIDLGW